MPVLYSLCTANVLCVLDGLSFPGSHPASYAGTKPVRMASSKADKNAHGNAPGCTQIGPCQANTMLQIMRGFQTVKQSQPGRRWFSLHSPSPAYPDLQGEWRSTWLQHSLSPRRKRSLPKRSNCFRFSFGFCRALRGSWILPFKGGQLKGAWKQGVWVLPQGSGSPLILCRTWSVYGSELGP